ncbi:MAG: hypothetical protein COW71_09645 [Ignavibacteriales bacterium CG18_big_fil_WC_8_21_14_2_50_31_20]|nr:MAG: hypothetical protein COW71_09645 [Ignavibacteriales bacterium CG18_big_fil_WC_8_21_14_2_50_31_20]
MKKTIIIIILLSTVLVLGKEPNKAPQKYQIDVFFGLGLYPLDANFGIGYFLTQNIVGYARTAILAMPMGSLDYSINIGAKYIPRRGNSFVSSFEFGSLFDASSDIRFSKISFENYSGITLKGGIGYMFINKAGYHLGGNFNFNSLMYKNDSDIFVFELEILMGISF